MEAWLPWQPEWNINNAFVILSSWQRPSFHGNEVWGWSLLSQRTSIPNVDSIWLKKKDLLSYRCGCHGNLVTIATRYATDAYLPKEPPYQIGTQSNFKTKELLTYHCGSHGNLVTIATRYVADAYRLIEPPCQIWTQYDLRQRSYKVKCIWLRLRLRLIDSDSLTKAVNSKPGADTGLWHNVSEWRKSQTSLGRFM